MEVNNRLAAIEAKQDQILAMLGELLDALADEGEEDEVTTITTMDGERLELPASGDHL